jgi:hypothetical protein
MTTVTRTAGVIAGYITGKNAGYSAGKNAGGVRVVHVLLYAMRTPHHVARTI